MTIGVGGSTMEAELERMSSMRDGVEPISTEGLTDSHLSARAIFAAQARDLDEAKSNAPVQEDQTH